MKTTYDIISVSPYRKSQNKKVFIYEDDEMCGYLWMSDDDLKKKVKQCKYDGDEVEIKYSYKDAK